jgi:hypothetical protein
MDRGNAAIKQGSIVEINRSILTDLKAEAAYFTTIDGVRGGWIVVNLDDASEIPAVAEPLFLGLGATVEFHPVMTPDDLAQAGPAIQQANQKYG